MGTAGAVVGGAVLGLTAEELLGRKQPKPPEIPELPTGDAAKELLRRQLLLSRIQTAGAGGQGRAATVATSPLGVTRGAATRRTTPTGA